MYCTVQEVYNATNLSSTEVSETMVTSAIKSAEVQVDRKTFTTYWAVNNNSQVVVNSTANTITVAGSPYTTDELVGMNVWVYSGTGIEQIRKIESNTTNNITLEEDWTTNPIAGDKFRVCYTATGPYFNGVEDGSGNDHYFVPIYPIKQLDELKVSDTVISSNQIYTYKEIGKLTLNKGAEKVVFSSLYPQEISLKYWYGVYPIPYDIKRYSVVTAALKVLAAQMGGTYDTPSTYSLPEGSVTIGQAYINIRGTFDVLMKEHAQLINDLIKYPSFV